MYSQLILFVLLYMLYQFISSLLQIEGSFGSELWHWFMAVLSVAILPLIYIYGKKVYQDWKAQREERRQQAEQESAARHKIYEQDSSEEDGDGV